MVIYLMHYYLTGAVQFNVCWLRQRVARTHLLPALDYDLHRALQHHLVLSSRNTFSSAGPCKK